MHAQRHMHEFGTTSEQLAEIAVGVREYATLNPNAMYRDPITVDDVVDSRMIADPLHKLDCCAITDGGGAFIMTTAERAADLAQPPVYVLGAAGGQTHWNISPADRLHDVAPARRRGPRRSAGAGVTHDDVDMLMFYDSFTITCLILLESIGFVPKGEGGPFVAEGHLKRGGKWPLNTDGGGLSSCHPGMRGIFLIIEAVRQLRGQGGEAQVPDCEVALCAGSGGWLSCIGVNVLGKGAPRDRARGRRPSRTGRSRCRSPTTSASEYWAGARARASCSIQECPTAGHRQFYPRALCTACGGEPRVVDERSGRGTIHTFTVIRQYGMPPFRDELPYVVAMVELPEGPLIMGNVTDCDRRGRARRHAGRGAFLARSTTRSAFRSGGRPRQ